MSDPRTPTPADRASTRALCAAVVKSVEEDAAFGERMFQLGSDYRMRMMLALPASEDWTPGCRRSAP